MSDKSKKSAAERLAELSEKKKSINAQIRQLKEQEKAEELEAVIDKVREILGLKKSEAIDLDMLDRVLTFGQHVEHLMSNGDDWSQLTTVHDVYNNFVDDKPMGTLDSYVATTLRTMHGYIDKQKSEQAQGADYQARHYA